MYVHYLFRQKPFRYIVEGLNKGFFLFDRANDTITGPFSRTSINRI